MAKEINRLKVVLAEKRRTNRWLAAQLGKNEATISKWCTNSTQPSLDDLVTIAKYLDVDRHCPKFCVNGTRIQL